MIVLRMEFVIFLVEKNKFGGALASPWLPAWCDVELFCGEWVF